MARPDNCRGCVVTSIVACALIASGAACEPPAEHSETSRVAPDAIVLQPNESVGPEMRGCVFSAPEDLDQTVFGFVFVVTATVESQSSGTANLLMEVDRGPEGDDDGRNEDSRVIGARQSV